MRQVPQAGKYFLPGLGIIFAIILADQYTKWLVMESLLRLDGPSGGSFIDWFITQKKIEFFIHEREGFKTIVLAPFLNFTMVWNQGISFGMMDGGAPYMSLILIALSLLISLALVTWMALTIHKITSLALGMIVGGAVANVMDRVRFGAVADFIDVHAGAYHWPAFNVADSFIVIGAGILMLATLLTKETDKEEKK